MTVGGMTANKLEIATKKTPEMSRHLCLTKYLWIEASFFILRKQMYCEMLVKYGKH